MSVSDDQPVTLAGAYCVAVLFALAPRSQIASLAVSQFLAHERWTRSSQGFRGVFLRRGRRLFGPVSRATNSSLLPYVLLPGHGGGLKLLRPAPVLRSLEKR
jgi:hypothetical protein